MTAIATSIREEGVSIKPPACVICGGESTVTIKGKGLGARNQELALAALARYRENPRGTEGIALLSAGADGSDDPTDAAGALCSADVLERARALDLDPRSYLGRNDSYFFFDASGGHVKTGPTNTDVCGLQILIVR